MDYTSRTRDRFRWAATGVTGLLTTGFLVGTGALAGRMAAEQQATDAARQQQRAEQYAAWQAQQARYRADAQARPRIVVRSRPTRTRVTTRYVTAPATGVSVSAPSSSTRSSSSSHSAPVTHASGGGRSGGSAPVHHTPPPPPPASSGS